MDWQYHSLVASILGVVLLGLACLAESDTWGNPLTLVFGVLGVFLLLTGMLHFLVNSIILELTKGTNHD